LQDTPQNRDFLISWFGILLNGNEHTIDVDKISSAVTRLYTLPQEQRQMKNCHLFFDDNNILAELSIWYGEGKYARLFDNEIDSLDLRNHIDGYGADALIEIGNKVLEPVIAYLLYWFNNSLDGSPAMLLLNDANSLLQNQQFGHDITEWLDYLTKKNAIGIFIKNIDANEPNILPIEKIVTKLFLPDSTPSKEYTEVLKLNNIEVEKIRNMKTIFRHFMIKQSEKSYIAELNLDGLDYALPILSGQEEHVAIINSMILEYGDDPASWVDPYYQKVEEILKQKNKKFRLTNE
jgi:type IV secretion system protein VirB4